MKSITKGAILSSHQKYSLFLQSHMVHLCKTDIVVIVCHTHPAYNPPPVLLLSGMAKTGKSLLSL